MKNKENKIFRSLTEEKIEKIKEQVYGLDSMEWNYIRGSIDMYFSEKAAKIKIDDLNDLDILLKRGC